jgi:hypothetical protein
MTIQPIQVIQGNYGYSIPFVIEDGNGDPQDLTGASVQMSVQDSQDPTGAVLFTGSLVVDSPTAGEVHYVVASGNFPNPGVFLAQLIATYSGEQITWPTFQIIVLPALPQSNN